MEKCNGTNGDKNGTRKENRNTHVEARASDKQVGTTKPVSRRF